MKFPAPSALLAVLMLLGPAAAVQAADNVVATDGSTSMEKVIGSLGEAFTNAHSGTKFTYNPTGSGAGIVAALEGRTDIGLSSRALKPQEQNSLQATVLALDGIVVVVNPRNPVSDLSVEQIRDIFTGRIASWKELGHEDLPIVLIGREAGSGTRDGFESVTGTSEQCRYRQELTSTGDVLTTVASNANAIGYISFSALSSKVKAVRVGGVTPDADSIAGGSYSLQRPFVLVTRSDRALSPTAQAFMAFATSDEARPILLRAGVIPPAR